LGAVNTGVPHAVLRVKGPLEKADVVGLGRALRRSAAFAPAGANVNFVELKGARVRVRTSERGVEDETMACGTGAVAAAMLASAWTGRKPPISVAARGGDLRVGWGADGVWLEGPARITYSGEAAL
jgi:diaminopimelate epimerase